jgi:DNA-binding NarL/FixJ family response regulator
LGYGFENAIMDGMEATRSFVKISDCKSVVVTMYEDDKFIIHLMEIGANGYLLKNTEPDEIRKSLQFTKGTILMILNKALLKKLVIKIT